MKTIKSLILSSFLLIFTQIYCQCQKRIDEFTNQVIIENKLGKLGKAGSLRPYFLKAAIVFVDSNFFIRISAEGSDIQTIEIDAVISFKFSDNSILSLKNDRTDIATPSAGESFSQGSKTTIWTNSLVLLIPQKDVESFSTKEISKIRCGINDYTVTENRSGVFIDQINCIQDIR